MSEARNRQQSAARKLPIRKELLADRHEAVAISPVRQVDGHRHKVFQVAAGLSKSAPDQFEARARLSLEIVLNRPAIQILQCSLPGEPKEIRGCSSAAFQGKGGTVLPGLKRCTGQEISAVGSR